MKTRKPKPPSNAEIYNLGVMSHHNIDSANGHLIHLTKLVCELHRKVDVLERTKEPKHYGRESE